MSSKGHAYVAEGTLYLDNELTLVSQLSDQSLGRAGSQGTHAKGSSVTSVPVPGLGGHGLNVELAQCVQVHSIFVEEGDSWKL